MSDVTGASTASDPPSTPHTTFAATFYETFQAELADLNAQLAALPAWNSSRKPEPTGGHPRHTPEQALLAALSRLTRSARDAATRLPPYDQRANALALQRFRERVDSVLAGPTAGGDGAAAAATPRFAFSGGLDVRADSTAASVAGTRAAAGISTKADEPAPPTDDAAAPEPPLEISALHSPPHLLSPAPSPAARPRTLIMTDLTAAAVDLRRAGPLSSASIRTGARALVVLPAVSGAVRLAGLTRSIIFFAGPAAQIRIHDCTECDFYVQGGAPVVEGVRRVRFAPAEEGGGGHWAGVQDFEWRRATQSPNWSVLPEGERLGPEVWALVREGAETDGLLRAVGLGEGTGK